MDIAYSDGAKIEARLLDLIRSAPKFDSLSQVAAEHYVEWPVEYHLCPERGNLLRPLNFEELEVIELGAGMGAVSRGIAERCRHLTVIEGTQARYQALSSRLRGLANWSGTVANIQTAPVTRLHDVACLIGVLEYAELFTQGSDNRSPTLTLLEQVKKHLKPNGVLILAIENRLGLKYWNGSGEDHTGRLFDGLCGYPAMPSPRTFSRAELLALLSQVGFGAVEEYYPFPDYKLPVAVLSRQAVLEYPDLAAAMATTRPYRDYSAEHSPLFSEILSTQGLATAGLIPELSNSFLFLAAPKRDSLVLQRLLRATVQRQEIAWHYANRRAIPVVTTFKKNAEKGLVAVKNPLRSEDARTALFQNECIKVRWRCSDEEPVAFGTPLRTALARDGYFLDATAFRRRLLEFLRWSLDRWNDGKGALHPEALDALVTNAVIGEDGYVLFDLEWSAEPSVPKSWFVLRNVAALAGHPELWHPELASCLSQLYRELCASLRVKPQLEADIALEANLRRLTSGRNDEVHSETALKRFFDQPIRPLRFPRAPGLVSSLRQALVSAPRRLAKRLLSQISDKLQVTGLARFGRSAG